MSYSQHTDAELLRLLRYDDEAAFRELYDRYQEEMYRVARRKVQSMEIAEEIVQEIYVGIWEKRKQLLVEDARLYLFRSVKNRVLDHIRAQLVRQQYRQAFTHPDEPAESSTEELLAFHELSNAVHNAMSQLSEKTQQIFRLSRFEYLSAEEIAQTLRIPQRTVEYHITLALRNLRALLKDFLPLLLASLLIPC